MRVILSTLRYHWSALPLALAAIALLVLGAGLGVSAPAAAAMVGAGAALAGAAATRIVDLDREHRAEAAQAAAARQRDLDETRRLAYMVLAAPRTERYELAATLVNALSYHQWAVEPDIAMRHVTEILNGWDAASESKAWLDRQIGRITEERDLT